MFFIGILGIQQKEKEVCILEDLDCKYCDKKGHSHLIKSYSYFHFFFIPVFKWNENYYVFCESCNRIYTISKEKGKRIENGEKNVLNYWDLKDAENYYNNKYCSYCNKEVDLDFEYCPYCGKNLKS